ncbi:MAG TPA: DNA polymerase Y family protein, partial [Hyphomicrobiaceae bacterium]|nr:DNA polymerase Y family protein [Hyphomicrobiaceae bacterium]
SLPSRDAAHMIRLMGDRLDAIEAGFGIDVMTLAATRTSPLAPGQSAAAGGAGNSADDDRLARLVDSLANRLESGRILRLALGSSHIPERASLAMAAMAEAGPERASLDGTELHRRAPPRPPTLLPDPEPIEVLSEVPEGVPQRFTWRRLTRRIAAARGPERIEPEWWRNLGIVAHEAAPLWRTRDYWQIEDEWGARYWVFRDGRWCSPGARQPRWYLHGLYG